MAKLEFLLQGVTSANHAAAIQQLLKLASPKRILLSVAFVRSPGVDLIEPLLKPLASKARLFIGIRNDLTSIQAVKQLLTMKVPTYAVDTATRQAIFHPKLYFAESADLAIMIVGSANLTAGGLYRNIELSTVIGLDLLDSADKKFAADVGKNFDDMIADYPEHVFLIRSPAHADELFDAGRLADEAIVPAPPASSSVKKGHRDGLIPMKLKGLRRRTNVALPPAKPTQQVAGTVTYQVWESKPLTERDLNIPSGKNTNPTGSMGFKKGASGVDQRHYFRDEIFADLDWKPDDPPRTWERATAQFELVIKSLNYGMFNLKLSHNTNRASRSYEQSNFMTQLHWGDAKPLVASRDLLGRTLYLYRRDTSPPEFVIEID